MSYAFINREDWYYCRVNNPLTESNNISVKIIQGKTLIDLPDSLMTLITIIKKIPTLDELNEKDIELKEQLSFAISEKNLLKNKNESLQAELDKEIKINHKLISGIKNSLNDDYLERTGADYQDVLKDTLKEIGEEE